MTLNEYDCLRYGIECLKDGEWLPFGEGIHGYDDLAEATTDVEEMNASGRFPWTLRVVDNLPAGPD